MELQGPRRPRPGDRSQASRRAHIPRQQTRGVQGAGCHGGRGRPRPVASVGKGTVAALCREWLDSRHAELLSQDRRDHPDVHRGPDHPRSSDPLQVAKLTPSDLDRFYRQLLEVGRSRGPYAPATIRRVHGIIRRALTQGVRWGWITHNPAIDASPPRVPMKELKPPDPDQVVQVFHLAQESDPELATFIMLAASSGARRGELLALRWSDIDLDRGRLSIERGIVRVGDDLIEQGTKTHQSRRISLDAGTVAALRAHEARMTERAQAAASRHHSPELRLQPFGRRLLTLASGLDVSSLPEDLPAGWGHGRSPPRSPALRGDAPPRRWRRRPHRRREAGPSGIRARPSTCTHISSQKLIKKRRKRSDESSRMPTVRQTASAMCATGFRRPVRDVQSVRLMRSYAPE